MSSEWKDYLDFNSNGELLIKNKELATEIKRHINERKYIPIKLGATNPIPLGEHCDPLVLGCEPPLGLDATCGSNLEKLIGNWNDVKNADEIKIIKDSICKNL